MIKTKKELLEEMHNQIELEVIFREIEIRMFQRAIITATKPDQEQFRGKLEALKLTRKQENAAFEEKKQIVKQMIEEEIKHNAKSTN